MSNAIDFLDLFIGSSGELLYFLTVTLIVLGSQFMAADQRRRQSDDPFIRPYVFALSAALAFWLTLLLGALIAEFGGYDPVRILPPLERFAVTGILIMLYWAYFTSTPGREIGRSKNLLWLGLCTLIAGYLISAFQWWNQAGAVDFNIGVIGATWTLATTAISIIGILSLLIHFTTIVDAPLKLLFFVILAIGNGWTLVQIAQGNVIGDYAGPPRAALVLALIIVPALLFRSIVDWHEQRQILAQDELMRPAADTLAARSVDTALIAPRPAERESIQLLRALGIMLENANSANISQRIISAVHEVLKADVVALLRQNDASYIDVVAAYDFAMEHEIDGISINLEGQPTLVNSIERQAGRSLLVERNQEELRDLYTRLDIEQTGPAFIQPLIRQRNVMGILLVANPYASRELGSSEEGLVEGLGVIAAGLLQLAYAASDAQMQVREQALQAIVQKASVPTGTDLDEVAEVEFARQQILELSDQVKQLKDELDDERTRFINQLDITEDALSTTERIRVLRVDLVRLQGERDSLAQRLQEAEAALQSMYSNTGDRLFDQIVDSLQMEKRKLYEEKARLEAELFKMRSGPQERDIESVLNRMITERSRLEEERASTGAHLDEIYSQLRTLGIEDTESGLAELINQLTHQRLRLQHENSALMVERDYLLAERKTIEGRIDTEFKRDEQLANLQQQIKNLAGDREAAFKQQEKMRVERDELKERLDVIKQHRARLLAQNAGYEIELREKMEDMRRLREKIEELENARSDLAQMRDELEAARQAAETERDQLMARMSGDRERLLELGDAGVGSLKNMVADLTAERNQREKQLNEAHIHLAGLESELDSLKRRSEALDDASYKYRPENPALLLGLVQELRTPMTSIIGYVDLLLGESAGILGEMQRKFLQRVSSNVKRLSSMVDDLVHVTELDAGTFPFSPAPVDLTSLIEDLIMNSSVQFREKGLVINLDLEDNLPLVHGDHDAINQIIGQLLTNAYLVSPPNSEVSVLARKELVAVTKSEELEPCLHVAITDRGGGIAPEDEPRVFARKYKAENPLIQGLGDTGVGLSIVKALVEAHNGRLWLETEENAGTTFNFALPTNQAVDMDN